MQILLAHNVSRYMELCEEMQSLPKDMEYITERQNAL